MLYLICSLLGYVNNLLTYLYFNCGKLDYKTFFSIVKKEEQSGVSFHLIFFLLLENNL